MAFLPQVYQVQFSTATTAGSVTSALELPGSYLYLYLQVPTMSVGYSKASTPIYLQCSHDNVTFYRYVNNEVTNNTLVAGINDYVIASSVSQRWINLPNFAFRYMRLEVSGTVTNPTAMTGGFKIVAVSNQ